jgi:gamma-glutamyl hercynylcysteine S-oxide synthase
MPISSVPFETPDFVHDWPLRDEDPAYFYFNEYALTMARLIADKNTRTPLTICLSGPWGAGKTTLLKRIRKMLDETRCLEQTTRQEELSFCNDEESPGEKFRICRTVWFDAWKYTGEDHILAALLRAIVNRMHDEGFLQAIKASITGPKKEDYRWAGILLNALTNFASTGTYDLNLEDYRVDTQFKTAAAFFDYFDSSLSRLIASWVYGDVIQVKEVDEKKGLLVIFIDDLDRCLPAKTIEVLEAIKLFLDKIGCAFVLGADIEVIQQAVAGHYKEAGLTGETVKDYLEKMIQLRFALPPILNSVMKDYLKAERYADDTILNNWQVLMAGADANPRRVKALINDINLQWAVLRNIHQADTVNRTDFVRWNILARAAPDGFLRQLRDIGDLNSPELQKKYIDDVFAWATGGSAESEQQFKQYLAAKRFRMVLRAIGSFSRSFDAGVMNSFLHLISPPVLQKAGAETIEAAPAVTAQTVVAPEIRAFISEKSLEIGGVQFILIPKGEFVMGSREDNPNAYDDEKPQHTVIIPYDFWIGKYPVTNEQFAAFAQDNHVEHPAGKDWEQQKDHPVINVDWHTARKYCEWIEHQQRGNLPPGYSVLLPGEAEWEKAARGLYGNEWPWGNDFDKSRCNTIEGAKNQATPVGAYTPAGDSPFGCADMAGNVWEWTRSLWGDDPRQAYWKYPYDANDHRREDLAADNRILRVLRGGSWIDTLRGARCGFRHWSLPDHRYSSLGFRMVVLPSSTLYSDSSCTLSL